MPTPSRRKGYQPIVQISTDGFAAYPEAVDLAFGPYVKYGTIIKEYRNAKHDLHPERNGRHEANRDKRNRRAAISGRYGPVHVERLNGTQRLFMKRLNRLTLLLLEEAPKPGSRLRHVRRLLQLLLANPQAGQERPAPANGCDDGRV